MPQVMLAKTAGFCFGVRRAIDKIYALLDEGKQVCTLGPVIHNPQMVEQLRRQGVRILRDTAEARPGETVVIRSHGVPQGVLDALRAQGSEYADATCPFVAKIHRIVRENAGPQDWVLVAGDKTHPEVLGIVGHTSARTLVLQDAQELADALQGEAGGRIASSKCILVAQTTFDAKKWEKCKESAKKLCTNLSIFDTICNATMDRQLEAEAIAAKADCMLVIGGRDSSNTRKLFDICAAHCKTFHVETADQVPWAALQGVRSIGVTAGASTPGCIIKEVQTIMSEVLENTNGGEELDFATALENSLKSVRNGEIVKGVVVGVTPTELQIDIGTKHAGYCAISEFPPDAIPKKGDELDLVVYRINDVEGTVGLSKRRFDAIKGWKDIIESHEEGKVLEGVVDSAVNGGILVLTNDIRVFVPASLASTSRVEDLSTLVGKQVRFKIIDVDRRRRRAVGSIKTVEREERKAAAEKLWETIEVGKVYTGTVKSMTSYGAFVDIGGADGMIHISELSWSKINHPSQVLNIGDTVEVYVKALDPEKKKISLGYRKEEDNPWRKFEQDYHVGDVVHVKVVSVVPFGAFAQIVPGIDGLIHISQLSNHRVEKVLDAVKPGDEVDAQIIDIDIEKQRISLSIRSLLPSEDDAMTFGDEPAEDAPESAE